MDASYKLHPWWWFGEPAVGVGVPGYNWEGGVLWLALRHFLGVEMEEVPEGLNGDGLAFADNGICLGDWALCMVLQFVHVASASVNGIHRADADEEPYAFWHMLRWCSCPYEELHFFCMNGLARQLAVHGCCHRAVLEMVKDVGCLAHATCAWLRPRRADKTAHGRMPERLFPLIVHRELPEVLVDQGAARSLCGSAEGIQPSVIGIGPLELPLHR
eukprot:jgi/Picre1/34441/NNA_001909.t1